MQQSDVKHFMMQCTGKNYNDLRKEQTELKLLLARAHSCKQKLKNVCSHTRSNMNRLKS